MNPHKTRSKDNKRKLKEIESYGSGAVKSALIKVREFLRSNGDEDYCRNINHSVTGTCACVFEMTKMENWKETDNKWEQFYCELAVQEIVTWFNSTLDVESIANKKQDPFLYMQHQYQQCVGVQPIHNGQQYTKYVYLNVPVGAKKYVDEGKWKGHDWDVGEEDERTMFHTTMCIPSVLLLWRALVGGDQWRDRNNPKIKQWKSNNYQQVMLTAGAIAEQAAKQKLRQRLFYARVQDYLVAPPLAIRIKYNEAIAKFEEMKWVAAEMKDDVLKERLKRLWNKWNLNIIHVVREGSCMNYNEKTKILFNQLKMKVRVVEPENVDFLNNLFRLVTNTLVTKTKWNKVARDKKLLYIPFDNCVNVRSAISAYYAESGDGTLSGHLKHFVNMEGYAEGVDGADADI